MSSRTADNVVEAIMLDCWPRMAACVDFDITTQEKYEAYYDPIRAGEIKADQLHDAVGDGKKLTKLLRDCRSQRHKDVEIKTPYDNMSSEEE